MDTQPRSISQQISCLARLTGAPETFVSQVRELFTRKGISLDANAEPYLQALEEAFQREETIRTSAAKARRSVSRLENRHSKLGQTYAKQVEQLKRIQANLSDQARRLRGPSAPARNPIPKVRVKSSKSSNYITRQQNEDLPMVPGPEDIQ